jgi:hypothetical protein
MSASDDGQKFFLGVNGEQLGPFSEAEVRQKLQAGEVTNETLVWYEGLAEWQPLANITYFKTTPAEPPEDDAREKTIAAVAAPTPMQGKFKPLSEVLGGGSAPSVAAPTESPVPTPSSVPDNEPEEPSISNYTSRPSPRSKRPPPAERAIATDRPEPAWKKKGKPTAPDKGEVIMTFALSGKKPRAVFTKKEAVFGAGRNPKNTAVLGIVIMALVGGFYYYVNYGLSDEGPKAVVAEVILPRDVRLARAKENIILNPAAGLGELRALLNENAQDDTGKAAYQSIELHYWEKQDYKGLGDLAMSVKAHTKAVEFFLKDPRLVPEAERAYQALFESTTDMAQKKTALLAQIEILLGPLRKKNEAIERILLFEKTFPNEPHAYQYYTINPSKQIAELFDRTSFYFLANLNGFIDGEFPQLKLLKDPSVEVRRDGNGYRITGSYRGEVRLYRDKLKGVYLHFWLVDGQWYVVETNITADRKRYAQEKKDQLTGKMLEEPAMLKYLESIFEQEFPRTPLHIRAPRNTAASAPRGNDSK